MQKGLEKKLAKKTCKMNLRTESIIENKNKSLVLKYENMLIEGYYFEDMILDISEKYISGSESYSELQTNLPTRAKNTLSSAGENIGNLADPRRTRSDFQRVGVDLTCHA